MKKEIWDILTEIYDLTLISVNHDVRLRLRELIGEVMEKLEKLEEK